MTSRAGALGLTAVLGASGLLNVFPIEDFDLWWLLGGGRYMVETRSFPTTDPFSATAAGAEWINHAWGFQLLLYAVHRLLGDDGMILLQAAFAVATLGLLYGILRRDGLDRGWALLLVALAAMATRGFWAPRPQVVTYFFLALFWGILRERRAGGGDRLLWLPPLTLVWVNLHGGFIMGPALIAVALVAEAGERAFRVEPPRPDDPGGRRLRRLALAAAGSMALALVNPFHYRAVLFPFQVLGDQQARSLIIEWASPPFQHPQVLLIEGLVLATLALLLLAARPVGWVDLAVLAGFVYFALQAIRNLPLLVLVLVPILGRVLIAALPGLRAAWAPRWRAARSWARRPALVAGLGLAVAGAGAWWGLPALDLRQYAPRLGLAEDVFPVGAVDFLERERPGGQVFNHYGWGGYLIWRLYPDFRVSIDGRAAVYGPRRFAEHVRVDDVHPGWRQTLDRLGATLTVIRARSPLATVLRLTPGWRLLYEDRVAAVFEKE